MMKVTIGRHYNALLLSNLLHFTSSPMKIVIRWDSTLAHTDSNDTLLELRLESETNETKDEKIEKQSKILLESPIARRKHDRRSM